MNLCKIFSLFLCLALLAGGCGGISAQQPVEQQPAETQIENLPPVISSFSPDTQVEPRSQLELTCEATDPEYSTLTYFWEVTGGKIDGFGSTATWTTPFEAGEYLIKVSVSDNCGSTSSEKMVASVPEKPNNPPVIIGFVFTRENHLPISIKMDATEKEKAKIPELVIKRYETAELSCIAEDPDGDKLNYVWLTSGGKIRDEGSMVYWITPGEAGDYIITVEISDGRGGTDSYTTRVTVKCCGI